ncbi:MAG: hypothetical protein JNL72_13360 [Flavipsychrobacter sp.]|nr:hypothetical protein [Flavipsychrobacter sp.]
MKSFFALLAVILFMAGTLVLGPVYLLLYVTQQFLYVLEPTRADRYMPAGS